MENLACNRCRRERYVTVGHHFLHRSTGFQPLLSSWPSSSIAHVGPFLSVCTRLDLKVLFTDNDGSNTRLIEVIRRDGSFHVPVIGL